MSKKFTCAVLALVLAVTVVCTSVTFAFAASGSGSGLAVNAKSNLFDSSSVTLTESQNQVRATFELCLTQKVVNTECEVIYDPAVLSPVATEQEESLPNLNGACVNFFEDNSALAYSTKYGEDDSRRAVMFNATSFQNSSDFSTQKVFVTILFDMVSGTTASSTDVELWVKFLGVENSAGTVQYEVGKDEIGEVTSGAVTCAVSSVEALPEETTETSQSTAAETTTAAAETTAPTSATKATTEPAETTTTATKATATTSATKATTEPAETTTAATKATATTSATKATTEPAETTTAATKATATTSATKATTEPAETTAATVPAQSESTAAATSASTAAVTYPDPTMLGDVNGDGKINIADVTMIQKGIAQILTLNDKQSAAADVNGDNKVTITDATVIQKFIAQIISVFPAEA